MITARPTEHLTGIIIEGEYEDFYELVDGIYRMTERWRRRKPVGEWRSVGGDAGNARTFACGGGTILTDFAER